MKLNWNAVKFEMVCKKQGKLKNTNMRKLITR